MAKIWADTWLRLAKKHWQADKRFSQIIKITLFAGEAKSQRAQNVGNDASSRRKNAHTTTMSMAGGHSWNRKSVCKLWWKFATDGLGHNLPLTFVFSFK